MTYFKKLIVKFADGKPICNCGEGYYKCDGKYYQNGQYHYDGKYCDNGCSLNQARAKEYVAQKCLQSL